MVLLAVGFVGPQASGLLDELSPDMHINGSIAVSSYATSVPGVFAAGDAMRGASLIVWAIADGRRAARAIDEYLMGSSMLPG
jgi:glutamate synthase (NADPH/NADH) small chain